MRSKTIDEYKHEVYTVVGDEYIVDGEYITNKTPIKMIHKNVELNFMLRLIILLLERQEHPSLK